MKLKRTLSILMAMLLTLPAGICGMEGAAYVSGTESIAIAASVPMKFISTIKEIKSISLLTR